MAAVSPNYTRYSLVEVRDDEFKLTCIHKDGYKSEWTQTFTRSLINHQSEEKTIPLETVAQKVISNTQSTNQGTALLAEAYLEAVANSIFNTESSKQFVKLSDLLSQFEPNKTLRT